MHLAVGCSSLFCGKCVCLQRMSVVPQCLCLQRLSAYQLISCRTMNISSRSTTRRPVVRSIFSPRYGCSFHSCPVGDSCSPQQSHQRHRVPWIPRYRDTKYPGVPRTVPGSPARHGVSWIHSSTVFGLNFRHF